jgi:hypothetical protein
VNVSGHAVVAGYGNWKKPTSPGLLGLSAAGTGTMIGGLLLTVVVTATRGFIAGLGVFVVLAVVVGVTTRRDKHGFNAFERSNERVQWWRQRSSAAHLYRSGPLGRTPWGTCQLPGIAASTTLTEFVDVYERPFAVISSKVGTYSVVLSAQPEGDSLVDPEQVDMWVSRWGGWLASLSDYLGLEAASVTIETAPDTGTRLRQEVSLNLDPNAPAFAREVMEELVESYPRGSNKVRAYVTLTFNRTIAGRKRSIEEMGRELATQLPNLTGSLEATGAGAVSPTAAEELCEIIRVAYDPAAAMVFDEAATQGQRVDLTWSDVGPSAHEASWTGYRHDSGVSRTWFVTGAPEGVVQSNILAGLLAPHGEIPRKRVTILYTPHDPARAAALVDADVRATRAMLGERAGASAYRAYEAAQRTANEQSAGAGLVSFGMLFTATVTAGAPEDQAAAAIQNLAAAARLRTRVSYGSQDTAFAAALPLGLHLPKFVGQFASAMGAK